MKLLFTFVCLVASVCLCPVQSARAQEFLTKDQALKLAFPNADSIEKKTFILTADLQKQVKIKLRAVDIKRLYPCYIGHKDGHIIGYAVIENVMGKHRPITYMTVLTPDIKIQQVEVLAYREPEGWEIRRENWRQQFQGKSLSDKMKVKNDIANISGATISCRALTDGVFNVLCYMNTLAPTLGEAPKPQKPIKKQRSQMVMGTLLDILVYHTSVELADKAITDAFAEVARLESLLSTYKDDSEISRLNANSGKRGLRVSTDTLNLLSSSLRFGERSHNAFNIAIGPVLYLWKQSDGTTKLPDAKAIASANALCDLSDIQIATDTRIVKLTRPGMRLDLGGIGKGYALDKAGELLRARGIASAILNFGGNVLVMGTPPDQTTWTVAVRDPLHPKTSLHTLNMQAGSISSTADYERGLTIDGKRYSHVIDPRSGQPVAGMAGVTVLADTATEADAWSTTLYVLGFKDGAEFARQQSISAMLMDIEGHSVYTGSYKKQLPLPDDPK